MSRRSRCNALTVNGCQWLWFRSPIHDDSVKWFWFDNDKNTNEVNAEYDASCLPQIECSYQSNLPQNFGSSLDFEYGVEFEDEDEDEIATSDYLSSEMSFSHCLLTELTDHMMKNRGLERSYILKFEFQSHHGQRQICKMSQLSLNPKELNPQQFSRDVLRTVNGRDSTWPQ